MKTIDERELQKTAKEKQTKTEKGNGNRTCSERAKAKCFCCAFKLGFIQLICKASLIFKLNLELVLSIILKQNKLYGSKHVSEECRCLLNMRFVILYDMLLNPSFKMTTSFINIARTIANTSKFVY